MPETKISSAVASDLKNAVSSFSIGVQSTDGAGDQEETEWTNTNWTKWYKYYKTNAKLGQAIDAKATWTIGKGFKSNEITEMTLSAIKGFGADTFNTILENCVRTYHIGGDSFCEIIRDTEGNLINIKPLDPGSIKIIVNRQGIIKRYEQISKVKFPNKKFKPEDIFHLSRNRVADEIHGQSMVERLEGTLEAKMEIMAIVREIYLRFTKPKFIFHLATDNVAEIAAFKAMNDKATGAGENIYVPKDAVVPELLALTPNSTLNPLPYIAMLDNEFFQAAGVPQIIVGGSMEYTEATAKIAYLAFEQTIEEEQLYIEEEVLSQLNLEIELEFPASMANDLISDKEKDGSMQQQTNQPSETTAGEGQ